MYRILCFDNHNDMDTQVLSFLYIVNTFHVAHYQSYQSDSWLLGNTIYHYIRLLP